MLVYYKVVYSPFNSGSFDVRTENVLLFMDKRYFLTINLVEQPILTCFLLILVAAGNCLFIAVAAESSGFRYSTFFGNSQNSLIFNKKVKAPPKSW